MADSSNLVESKSPKSNGTANGKTHAAKPSVKDASLNVQQTAKGIVGRQLDVALGAAGRRAENTASSLREVSGHLGRSADTAFVGDVAQTLAGYVDRVAEYLTLSDSTTVVADVERYGRRNPVVIGGAALAAGFLASRLIKVSSEDRYLTNLDDQYASK